MNLSFSSVVYFFKPSFILFFIATFSIYWSLPRYRNRFLLFASYFFYGCWDVRFLSLIVLSTLIDFYSARLIVNRPEKRRLFLYLCVGANLLILGVFKYAQFFVDSTSAMLEFMGFPVSRTVLEIILPLGISFYTFQSISYVIDVYRRKFHPHNNLLEYALFVIYFPQLIAGPIERVSHLLPEILKEKKWKEIPWAEGIYLFAIGFFKKRVIADFLAYAAHRGYAMEDKPGIITLTGFLAYTFEVYGDISGYADMARGMSLLLGIRLSPNFYFPYFSRDPVDYWKRWHITLSVWSRHYIFTPLITRWKNATLAILATFMVMGIWHGPRWHYVHWGLYWAFWSIAYQRLLKDYWNHFIMILVIFVGQSFFRTDSVTDYINLWLSLKGHFWTAEILSIPYIKTYLIIGLFIVYEYWCLKGKDELRILRQNFYVQAAFYFALFFLYRNIGETAAIDFVYFQF